MFKTIVLDSDTSVVYKKPISKLLMSVHSCFCFCFLQFLTTKSDCNIVKICFFCQGWCSTWPPPARHCFFKSFQGWREMQNFPVKNILTSTTFSFPVSHFHFCLSSRHCLSLWAVAGCSQRKWCCPSGVVINTFNGEQVLGMGHIKTSYTLNPQHNPGMHYNEENHFEEKCRERQQSCGKCFRDNRKTTFLHFHLDSFSNLGCRSSQGKSSIKYNFSNAFHFPVKISGLDIYLSHFLCLSPWST